MAYYVSHDMGDCIHKIPSNDAQNQNSACKDIQSDAILLSTRTQATEGPKYHVVVHEPSGGSTNNWLNK